MPVSPKQYRYALAQLGLDQPAAAKLLNVEARTSRRYAERGITSGPAELLLRLLLMKSLSPNDIVNALAFGNRSILGPR